MDDVKPIKMGSVDKCMQHLKQNTDVKMYMSMRMKMRSRVGRQKR